MTAALSVDGIDISRHKAGKIDFPRAKKAGLEWVYCKATEGETWVDPTFGTRRQEVGKAGLPYGGFHFARAAVNDSVREARHFMSICRPKPGDLLPALDIETDEGLSEKQLDKWAKEFVDEVHRISGYRCVIYTQFNLPSLGEYPLWVARYSNENAAPRIPGAWKQATIRQFSNGEYGVPNEFAGITGTDLNTWGPGASLSDIIIPQKVVRRKTRGPMIDGAILDLSQATGSGARRQKIDNALAALRKIPYLG